MFNRQLPVPNGRGSVFDGPIFTGISKFADGTAAAPSITFNSNATHGIFYAPGSARVGLTQGGICVAAYTSQVADGLCLKSSLGLSWSSNDPSANGADVMLMRDAPQTLAQVNGNNDQKFRIYNANGGYLERGCISELITLSTVGVTTDSAANLLPANATLLAVSARITVTIATATNWSLGDATTAARFAAANAVLAAGTTAVGLTMVDQTGAPGPKQSAAAKLRITTTGIPSAGQIRVTVHYEITVPHTS